jgi:dodecin
MSVVKVIELMAQSENGWEDAAQKVVDEASKSLRNIQSVYIKDFEAKVEENKLSVFRVKAKVSFLVE